MLKKVFTVLLVLAFFLPALYSQSLVDLAKKEKARRAELKEKRGPVVTNADLGKRKAAEETTAGEQTTRPRQPGAPPADSQQVIPVLTKSSQTMVDEQAFLGGSRLFATRVRSEFEVDSPQNALKKPDGAFAEIRYYGYLDLEIELVNQDGDDVAVYSRGPGAGVLPEMMAYAVFAGSGKDGEEDWIFLGQGNGRGGPETFDLGELASARSLRILYRMFPAERELAKPLRDYPREYGMRIDAVKSLH